MFDKFFALTWRLEESITDERHYERVLGSFPFERMAGFFVDFLLDLQVYTEYR